ncbi:MAG: HAD-IA family hydrolase [Janthinobacterium lividum]
MAFDIIGTVFPLEPLRSVVVSLGLPPAALEGWFAAGLRDAFALSAAGDFAPLPEVLGGALDQVLAGQGLRASPRGKAALLDGMKRLPPRPDARDAFGIIAGAGMRIVAISNGSRAATRELLRHGRLEGLVAQVASVEDIGVYKPHPEVYAHAVRMAGTQAGRVALVAVHPWDINGAKAAGLMTAFVSAEGPYSPVMRKPDVAAPTLAAAARALVAL